MLITIRVHSELAGIGETRALCELSYDPRKSHALMAESLVEQWQARAGALRLDDEDRRFMREKLTSWLVQNRHGLRYGEASVFEYLRISPPPRPTRRPRPMPQRAETQPDVGAGEELWNRIETAMDWTGGRRG